jgi:hypothetical protein
MKEVESPDSPKILVEKNSRLPPAFQQADEELLFIGRPWVPTDWHLSSPVHGAM